MKSKKIIALALIAAMSISMASMTAFADDPSTDPSTDPAPASSEETVEVKVGKKGTTAGQWDYYQQVIKGDSTKEENTTEAYAYAFQPMKVDSSSLTPSTSPTMVKDGDVKFHVLLTGTLGIPRVVGTKTYTDTKISKTQQDQKGTNEAKVTFANIKSQLKMADNDPESDYKQVGWTLKNNETVLAASASTDGKILKDGDVLNWDGNTAKDGGDSKANAVKIYPVYQVKNSDDKRNDLNEIAARPKIAKKSDDSDWKYTQQEIEAMVSKEKGEDAGGKESAEKCNTTLALSRVFDVKPVLKEDKSPVQLRTSQKPQVDVVLPLGSLKDANDTDLKNKDKINEAIQKGKLKVFHIGSDGKSHPVSGVSAKDDENVTFKYGTFSDFVLTVDPNAKAQAGEEEGASAGNPATGEASALPVAMLALAALSATGVVAYKKRKAE